MKNESKKTRTECDLLGCVEVPDNVLYGVQTMRGLENFAISKFRLCEYPRFIEGLAIVKLGAAIANHALLAKSDMASFVDSLVAPLSMVNALIVAVGRRKNEDLSRTFETLERIWDEYEVYEKVEEET